MRAAKSPPAWAWLLAGIFLLQTAWTLVVPPYAGIDEFDHAYRAASVAEGHWVPGEPAINGRGYLLPVPAHIVDSAHKACSSFDYVGPDNCNPTTSPGADGTVLIASGAGNYNPFYYAVVGLPTLLLEGEAALYGMRLANVILCSIVLGLCLRTVTRQSRSAWPAAGVGLTLTPVVMYASSTVAPHGLEIVSGMLMWTTGLVLAYGSRPTHRHWWLLALAMGLVATLHTTGPLWCVLFGLCFLISGAGRSALHRAWVSQRAHLMGAAAAAVVVGLADAAWTLVQGTNIRGGEDGQLGAVPVGDLLRENLLWVFQTIGAVPFRNQHIPVPAMAAALVLFLLVLVLATRRATVSERIVLGLLILVFFGIGTIATVVMYDKLGLAWQGRYAMPIACGLPLLCCWLLSRSRPSRLTTMLPPLVWAMFVTVNGWSLVAVLDGQRAWEPPLDWTAPPTLLLVAFGVAAAVPVGVAHRRHRDRPLDPSMTPVGTAGSTPHRHAGVSLAGSSIRSKEAP